MENVGRALGTAAVWGGVAGLSYLFNSMGHLTGGGAVFMVIAAFVLTIGIWKL